MALGSQRDNTKAKALGRSRRRRKATTLLLRAIATRTETTTHSSSLILHSARPFRKFQRRVSRYTLQSRCISTALLSFNCNRLTDEQSLNRLPLRKNYVRQMVDDINWPGWWTIRSCNRYHCNSMLVMCVKLRRLSIPACWTDMERQFAR